MKKIISIAGLIVAVNLQAKESGIMPPNVYSGANPISQGAGAAALLLLQSRRIPPHPLPPLVQSYLLEWGPYGPAECSNTRVYFEVEHCSDLAQNNWIKLAAVGTNTSFVVTTGLPADFFRIRVKHSVTLQWDPTTDPSVIGTRIYRGIATRNYTRMLDAAGSETRLVFDELEEGTTYYFSATHFTADVRESGFSNEVVYTPPSCSLPIILRIRAQQPIPLEAGQ